MAKLLLTAEPFLTGKPLEVWLDNMGIKDWNINGDGLVNVNGDVLLTASLGELKRLPSRFGKVSGDFICDYNQLVSLEGAPLEIGGNFYCNYNQLVNLKGSPLEVVGGFLCNRNQLMSLEGAPESVTGDFNCNNNQLVSLDGAPKRVGGDFWCGSNQLVSLEGAPQVSRNFDCGYNQLVSLEGTPKKVSGWFSCICNQLVDFKGMEGVSIGVSLFVTSSGNTTIPDNIFVSMGGLPKKLYSKVKGLDIQSLRAVEAQYSDIPDIEI